MSQEVEEFKSSNPELYQKIIDSLAGVDSEEGSEEVVEEAPKNERGMLGDRDSDGTLISVSIEEDPEADAPEAEVDFLSDLMAAEWTEDSIKAMLTKHDKTPEDALDLYAVTGEGANKLADILKSLSEGDTEFVDLSKDSD